MTLKPSAGTGSALEWIKSSYSTDDGPDCVEVAATPGTIHVRDSKAAPQGPRLAFTPDAWTRFVTYAAER
ncbi:DUF397 domain-containing protein [Streptomyces rhizosphaericus]|uniref:DUF397 domain-containing protein n=1 Tax=Streptomyces rhizosphaericus TaxID=114699 RepID=A0A6G4AUP3_9ACTN|nr:DUF397 domain-containing protein [Streptomyces rhizosphaericus]NEW76978.1 DUF397 domain-containing protein [Streptomyces rhizosphaericus]